MQYYTPPPPAEGMPASDCIVREDGAWIPPDPANRDYADYLAWCDEGNQAQPWPDTGIPVPPPPEAKA